MLLRIMSSQDEKTSDIARDLEGVSWKVIDKKLSSKSCDSTTPKADQKKIAGDIIDILKAVSYTHLTLPTILLV